MMAPFPTSQCSPSREGLTDHQAYLQLTTYLCQESSECLQKEMADILTQPGVKESRLGRKFLKNRILKQIFQ